MALGVSVALTTLFPNMNANFIVDLGANRLPFILRHNKVRSPSEETPSQ